MPSSRFLALLVLAACAKADPPAPAPAIIPAPVPIPSPSPAPSRAPPPAPLHGDFGIVVAPSSLDVPRPAIVYFHGTWASPEDSCSYFERGAAPFGFLVCPRGNARAGAGYTWNGGYAIAGPRLAAALDRAEAMAPSRLAKSGGTLVGFSIGAKVALDVALAEPGRWSGMVLMSMRLALDAAKLRAAGVQRIVLAAADDDGARASLVQATDALVRAGVDARFVSLGRVGHHFAADMEDRMADAIAWVHGAT